MISERYVKVSEQMRREVNMKKIVMYNTEGSGCEVEQTYLNSKNLKDYELIRVDSNDDERFFDEAKDADAVIIVYLQANEEAFRRLENCKVLTTQCIGVNNIDIKAATKHGIYVGNVPDYCIEEVAIHTVSMMLTNIRRLSIFNKSVQEGVWNPKVAGEIHRVSGHIYGLAGFGNIPKKIVELMKGFGVSFVAYDPYCVEEDFENYGVERIATLEELFAISDYLSVHIPLLENTRNIIDKSVLAHAKKGMMLVTTGRGGVIDEMALKEKIEDDTIRSVGVDVIADEQAVKSPLFGMENVIVSPHVAYYSDEAIIECREKAIMQIVEVLEYGKAPTYLVNKDMK